MSNLNSLGVNHFNLWLSLKLSVELFMEQYGCCDLAKEDVE